MQPSGDRIWRVDHAAPRIFRITRTAAPYASIDEVHATFLDLRLDLRARLHAQPLARAPHGLLVALRDGPLRSDPPFEEAAREHRPRLFEGFAAGAVLVRTLSGKIQLSRQERVDRAYRSFDDEEEALAFLRDALDGA